MRLHRRSPGNCLPYRRDSVKRHPAFARRHVAIFAFSCSRLRRLGQTSGGRRGAWLEGPEAQATPPKEPLLSGSKRCASPSTQPWSGDGHLSDRSARVAIDIALNLRI